MKTAVRPLWLNSQLPQLLRPRLLWGLQALPLAGLVLSFVPWFAWLLPWIDVRYPMAKGLTGEIVGAMLLFLGLMLAGIVGGMWLGWRLNELICRRIYDWPAEAVHRVFRQSHLPPSWLKAGVASTDADAEAARVAKTQMQGGVVAYVLKVGVLRWGLAMFIAMAVVPKLLQGGPLQPGLLAIQALIWLVGGACFGLALRAVERAKLRKRSTPGAP